MRINITSASQADRGWRVRSPGTILWTFLDAFTVSSLKLTDEIYKLTNFLRRWNETKCNHTLYTNFVEFFIGIRTKNSMKMISFLTINYLYILLEFHLSVKNKQQPRRNVLWFNLKYTIFEIYWDIRTVFFFTTAEVWGG